VIDVHPTALVDPKARLGARVKVGPYSLVGPDVSLAEDVEISGHVVVTGRTNVGRGTRVFPFTSIGDEPQDKSFTGEPTRLEIGAANVIREHVTIHVGTPRGGGCTRIGDDNLIMTSTHVGHDCQIGSHVILASYTGLAGHVIVEDFAVLGAYTGVHQFCRVGESVMCGANTKISLDAPPFSLVAGDHARLAGLNTVGLKRRGFGPDQRRALKRAFRLLFSSKLRLEVALARVREELADSEEVSRLVRFVEKSERGVLR
jgi:UDP-N-acetylglucosamine acyltransferase